jgi:regulator of protease activity HflC (stomatin/prohibitin superfamily)
MTEAAARRSTLWFTAGGLCLLGGLAVALGPVLFLVAGPPDAPNALGWYAIAGGALHTAAAALLGAALFVRGRHKAATFVPSAEDDDDAKDEAKDEKKESGKDSGATTKAPPVPPTPAELAKARHGRLRRASWSESGLVLVLACVGLALRWRYWPTNAPLLYDLGLGITAFVASFPLLVLERRLAWSAAHELPEAAGLARVLRAALVELACAGLYALTRRVGFESGIWIARGAALLGFVVAAELALRALCRPLLPLGAIEKAKSLVDSFSSSVLLARLGPARGLADALRDNFGVDLGRLWAIRFLRSAAAPLVIGLLAVAWGTTGVSALAPAERGVYERLGRPVAVLQPGLHFHLPWPLGAVRRLEFGVVHETPVAVDAEAPVETAVGVEDAPPPSADRLWSQAHPTEGSYLIPGAVKATGTDQPTFQLASADVRIGWRIGLDDDSARHALFLVADGDALVRALAGRLLVRDFATRPLEKIIGDDRDRLAASIETELQAQLDALKSGLEVTAVLIDAIHPPVGAAAMYHKVQASEIVSMTMISVERTRRARLEAETAAEATDRKYAAQAFAGEHLALARGNRSRFDADQASFGKAGPALALERWLQTIERALQRCKFDLIDHRLELDPGPTLDLRALAPSAPAGGYE